MSFIQIAIILAVALRPTYIPYLIQPPLTDSGLASNKPLDNTPKTSSEGSAGAAAERAMLERRLALFDYS